MNRYFLYRLTWNGARNKFGKQPCSLDGQRCPVSAADNLVSREQAEIALTALGDGYALGLWLTADDGLFFIDCDECVANGKLADEAGRLLAPFVAAGCYYELSSSGRGVHIIGRYTGALPSHSNRRERFEFYTTNRGVALNPAQMQGSMDIDATSLLPAMLGEWFPPRAVALTTSTGRRPDWRGPEDDDELIRRALAATGSAAARLTGKATLRDLWENKRPSDTDRSGDDMALASHLAFWTGCDAPRIERLMLRSGLAREKWRDHRTYLSGTIAQACATTTNVYRDSAPIASEAQMQRAGTYTADDLMRRTFNPVQWTIRDLLPEGVTILSGDPKVGKSWLVYQACLAVATGTALWSGREPEAVGDALMLALEDNDRRLRRRMDKLLVGAAKNLDLSRLHIATDWPRSIEGVARIADWLREHPTARLVVIDTISAFRDRDPGRKSSYAFDYEVGEMLKPLTREFSVAIVLVMHNRKQGANDPMQRVSGTQGLTGSVDNVLVLSRANRGDKQGVLSADGRDIENAQELALSLHEGRWSYMGLADEVARSSAGTAVLDALRAIGGIGSAQQIRDAIGDGTKLESLRMRLSRMVKRGEILRNGHNDYSLPSTTLPEPPSLTLKPLNIPR